MVIGGIVLAASFGIIILQLVRGQPAPTEAWFTVGGVMGHWFGKNGNGHTNGNGNGTGAGAK